MIEERLAQIVVFAITERPVFASLYPAEDGRELWKLIRRGIHAPGRSASITRPERTTPPAAAPAFTLQPVDQLVIDLDRVAFRVNVSGVPTPTLMWQVSTNQGATWTNLANVAGYVGPTLAFMELETVTAAQNNNLYRCVATNTSGTTHSRAASLTVGTTWVAPTITTQPLPQSVKSGGPVSFKVAAGGTETLRYQWYKNGVSLGFQTAALVIPNVQPSHAGNYTATVTNRVGSVTSQIAALSVPSNATAATRFANIATRAFCSTGNAVTIGGFVVAGSSAKRVLVRAVGPSLTAQGISASEVLLDPGIAVYDAGRGNALIATNDNWGDNLNRSEITTTAAQIGAAAFAASDANSSALLLTLNPGVYSFVVSGKAGTSGIVLLEVYDADSAAPPSTFVNIATRARCTTGNGVTIGGFVVSGTVSKQILLRAIGPTLTSQGLSGSEVLADPVIDLYDAVHGNVIVASNDNWGDNSNTDAIRTVGARIGASPLATTDTKSAALLLSLPPGVYSFVARGRSDTTGVLLVEVYDAD